MALSPRRHADSLLICVGECIGNDLGRFRFENRAFGCPYSATCHAPQRHDCLSITITNLEHNSIKISLLDPSPTLHQNRPRSGSSPSEVPLELPGVTTPTELPTLDSAATPRTPWSPAVRFAFRIAFLYFFCFIFVGANGTLLDVFPVVGGWIQDKLNW